MELSMQNITFSADENLIATAQAYAQSHGTTLNALIRDFLLQITGKLDPKAVAEEFSRLACEQSGCSEEGWRFNREEIHKRGSWM
jgi:hypothetical protein